MDHAVLWGLALIISASAAQLVRLWLGAIKRRRINNLRFQ